MNGFPDVQSSSQSPTHVAAAPAAAMSTPQIAALIAEFTAAALGTVLLGYRLYHEVRKM